MPRDPRLIKGPHGAALQEVLLCLPGPDNAERFVCRQQGKGGGSHVLILPSPVNSLLGTEARAALGERMAQPVAERQGSERRRTRIIGSAISCLMETVHKAHQEQEACCSPLMGWGISGGEAVAGKPDEAFASLLQKSFFHLLLGCSLEHLQREG